MTTAIMIYVGIVLLLLLSIQDFSSKVIRQGNFSQYYFCESLFIILNLIIYVTICAAILQVKIMTLLSGKVPDQSQLENVFIPLMLAFAYFGIGSVNIPIGGKAVSMYGSLLKLFQGMYKPNDINIDPIKTSIQRLNTQSDELRKAIESFNEDGRNHGWNTLSDKWDELSQDRTAMERHRNSLRDVRKELCESNKPDINTLTANIDEKIKDLSQNMNDKFRRHISALVEANDKNSVALKELLSNVGLKLPESSPTPKSRIQICRSIVLSLFCGALLGAVMNHLSENPVPVAPQSLSWMVALGIFGVIFSSITYLSRNKIYWALGIGAAAGAAGQLALKILTAALSMAQIISLNEFYTWMPKLMLGIVYGGCLAALIHVFRYLICPKLKNSAVCYLVIAFSGAALFILLGYIMRSITTFEIHEITTFVILGAFVSSVSAIITNIFHESI